MKKANPICDESRRSDSPEPGLQTPTPATRLRQAEAGIEWPVSSRTRLADSLNVGGVQTFVAGFDLELDLLSFS